MALPSLAESRAVYGRLLRYAWPWRWQFLLGILGMALYAATGAGTAGFVSRFLRAAFVRTDPRVVWAVPAGAFLLFLARSTGDFLGSWYPARVGRQVVKAIRRELFDQCLHLPAARYDQLSTGRMVSRLTYDAEQVADAATNSLIVLVRDSLTILGLLAYMFLKSWRFTLLALVVTPVIGWVLLRLNQRFRRHSARIQQSMGDVTRIAKESFEGQRSIKTSGAQAAQLARFEVVNEQNRYSQERLARVRAAANPVVQMVGVLGLLAVLVFALWQVVVHGVTVDEFTGYITALLLLLAPLRRIVD
ncbi:MAG TPA: ABC transporter transmembrane domain-containing protein, partial [Steroidobacteraceae bacterium]|nr:ABC transporter transmembrane domain-containing protein [Steroidobacteraceae bacterium]